MAVTIRVAFRQHSVADDEALDEVLVDLDALTAGDVFIEHQILLGAPDVHHWLAAGFSGRQVCGGLNQRNLQSPLDTLHCSARAGSVSLVLPLDANRCVILGPSGSVDAGSARTRARFITKRVAARQRDRYASARENTPTTVTR